jgi:hypothetical protein
VNPISIAVIACAMEYVHLEPLLSVPPMEEIASVDDGKIDFVMHVIRLRVAMSCLRRYGNRMLKSHKNIESLNIDQP